MQESGDLIGYYANRAAEYESVYAKPGRQSDAILRSVITTYFTGCRVLEVVCGTGYWTAVYSSKAASVITIDMAPEVLALARTKPFQLARAKFQVADAYRLNTVEGDFNSCFAGFWWSHVPRQRITEFLLQLHECLGVGAKVMFVDNRYVEGSSTPISRVDGEGNSYQNRRLEDGTEFEVLKNFPKSGEIGQRLFASGAKNVEVIELKHCWYVTYLVRTSA